MHELVLKACIELMLNHMINVTIDSEFLFAIMLPQQGFLKMTCSKLITSQSVSQNLVFQLCHLFWHKICRISCRADASSLQAHATEVLYLRRIQLNSCAKGEGNLLFFLLFSNSVALEFCVRCSCRSR